MVSLKCRMLRIKNTIKNIVILIVPELNVIILCLKIDCILTTAHNCQYWIAVDFEKKIRKNYRI